MDVTNRTLYQNLTRTQEKGAVTPEETDPDLPRSLWQRRRSACCRVGDTECAWDLLKEVTIIFITSTIVWPQVNNRGGEHSSIHQQKIGLKIY